jgi:hypothetical protein
MRTVREAASEAGTWDKPRMSEGGAKYATFLEQELKAERDRRTSLDARAQSFVTASGSLVALLAALSALIGSRKDYTVPSSAHIPLLCTVALFWFTLMAAILATFNFKYDVAKAPTLEQMPREHWRDDESTAMRNIAAINVSTVLTLRYGNNKKVTLLLTAFVGQLLSLACLGLTAYIIVISG